MAPATHHFTTNTPTPKMWYRDITDKRARRQAHISSTDWLVPFPEAGLAELDAVLEVFDRHPQPVHQLTLARLPNLPTCHQVMAQVRTTLHQTGIAIVDRLPVERYGIEQNKVLYRLLGQMLGRVVDQKWGGTTLYDVKDIGKPLGHGVRRSVTNLDQPFHTDGPWLSMTPEIISLLCLQTAQSGGMSRLVSLLTAHNEMRHHHPDLIERLYYPFVWDRQAEHGPGDVPYSTHPMFAYDGEQLSARYYDDYIHKGYALAGEVLDARGKEAIDAMQTIVNDAAHWVELRLASGQLQYLNNHQFAHARTSFTDNQATSMQRHLIRCWYRNDGRPALEGRPVRRPSSPHSTHRKSVMNMDMATLLYAGAVLFLAYLVRGIAGFGSGLIAVPLLALRFPVTVVVPLVVFLDYVGSASQGLKNRTHIVWRDQLPLIPFSLIGVGVGLLLLSTMSKPDLGKALGGFVLIYAVYQLLPLPPLKGSRLFAVPCGLLGGFIGTLFGTGGPLYVMYFNLRQMAKTGFRATFASNFLIDGGIRLVGYTTAGLFHGAILLSMLAALPVVGAGLYVGGRFHTGFSQETFKRFISVLLLCSGIALLLKS